MWGLLRPVALFVRRKEGQDKESHEKNMGRTQAGGICMRSCVLGHPMASPMPDGREESQSEN